MAKPRTEVLAPPRAIPIVALTPAALLQIAVENGADIDRLSQLMDLQAKWEANESRKAYHVALAAFKADPPKITKNKRVSFDTGRGRTEYNHATLDHVSEAIGAALTKHGLSHRWEVQQKEALISVSCVLTHVLGHSERVTLEAGADTSGSKNSIQAIGSTVTYLERYTLLAATGMATVGQDNDGAGTGKEDAMDAGALADHLAAIESCADVKGLQQAFSSAYTAAQKAKDHEAIRKIVEAKDSRKKALGVKS